MSKTRRSSVSRSALSELAFDTLLSREVSSFDVFGKRPETRGLALIYIVG
jgi:hypothetical protein